MNLGLAIQKVRKSRNISQGELSQKSGLTRTYLSLIENGKRYPSLETLNDIANHIGVPVATLFICAIEENDLPEATRPKLAQVQPLMERLMATLYDEAMCDALGMLER